MVRTHVKTCAPVGRFTDRGLAKACARATIPVPGLGYWAKLAHGKKVSRIPLPTPGPKIPGVVEITPPPPKVVPPRLPSEIEEQIAAESALEWTIMVPKGLSNPHRVVQAWLEDERRRKQTAPSWPYGLSSRRRSEPERRRLRILSTLFRALEKRGHKVTADPGHLHNVWAVINGEKVEFTLNQRQRKFRIELTPEERRAPHNIVEGVTFRTEQRTTDELVFKIRSLSWPDRRVRREWADASGMLLDEQLNEIVAGFIAAGAVVRERRLAQAEEERRRRERELQCLERERVERAETQRVETLFQHVARWRQAADLRAYVKAVRAAAARRSLQIDATRLEQWASWTLTHADKIDPLRSVDPGGHRSLGGISI